jgi:hypothetical protein
MLWLAKGGTHLDSQDAVSEAELIVAKMQERRKRREAERKQR